VQAQQGERARRIGDLRGAEVNELPLRRWQFVSELERD
jgi:hypothetical protein